MKDYLQQTIDTYDAHATEFEQSRAAFHQSNTFAQFIALLPGKKVLDLGCGPGRDVAEFVRAGYQVTGLDLSAGLLTLAREKVPEASFVQGDMTALPFADQTFAGVWTSASLLHLKKEDAKVALSEIHRVLQSGGVVYISVKQGEGEGVVADERMNGAERFFVYYTEEELCDLSMQAGFVVLQSSTDVSDNMARSLQWVKVFLRK